MSLTDDWKAGKLPFGEYYCRVTDSPYIEKVMSDCMAEEDIVEILAPVPSYEEIQRLKKDIELKQRYINARESPVYREETYRLKNALIDELNEKINALEKEVAKGDRIIGELLNEGSSCIVENKRLKELLKEYKEVLEDTKKDRGVYFNNLNLTDLLTRINAAIGESEEL